ncbi:MAG: hypothetical protein Q9222_006380 [Ikaeria aurantiellina]
MACGLRGAPNNFSTPTSAFLLLSSPRPSSPACLSLDYTQNSTMNSTMMSLTDLLGATDSLSTLTSTVMGVPGLAESLSSASNITILAPSNDAFEKFLATPAAAAVAANDTAAIQALLSYHVLNGTYPASAVMETPAFIPTMLNNSAFANVTGGQVVEAVMQEDNVLFYSGLLSNSSVTTADQNFTGGVVHVIDTILTIPQNVSSTAVAAGLSGVAGALTRANLVDAVDSLEDVTIFAPNNAAFQAIGSALPNMTTMQLASILQYHVVNGTVAYSSTLMDGSSIPSMSGQNLMITMSDGDVFVNSAKVVMPDVLVANGVVHVIDNVLNPNNTMAMPDPTASMQTPAFPGATSASDVDFTSGIPTPTMSIGMGPTMAEEGDSMASATTPAEGGARPMMTGAVGAAALFAGAGVWMNA